MARVRAPAEPSKDRLIRLEVLRSTRISPHFQRVTLGGEASGRFVPAPGDQRVRLFIPVAGGAGLERLPQDFDLLGRLRYRRIARAERPIVRDYTVRAFRAVGLRGPELDIDFVLHGHPADGTAGAAAAWAAACRPGDAVAVVDKGTAFEPARSVGRVLLVADETGVPAVGGILASLPDTATGTALLEVPTREDQFDLPHPAGVSVYWASRNTDDVPGATALGATLITPIEISGLHAYVAGEQALVRGARRHLLSAGVPRNRITSVTNWRHDSAR